ncbi:Protein MEI2-like 4 [Gossypium arboreum]|uniref:Protein MEI2-like 4 n=1 Tax=Gossypium arboreum TaxID=29729 RepID=A0A0B0NA51_GOSAR|nr:Protein MEI2-like 4 [Gossypium arboreum]
MGTYSRVLARVQPRGLTDLGHTANHTSVCLAVCPSKWPHMPGYIDLCHIADHMPVCETVWSILTLFQLQYQGTHGRET